LFTFLENGGAQFILELYDPASGDLSQFILQTAASGMEIDPMNPIGYVWVEHQAKAMIAVLTNGGTWYVLDPLDGNRYTLNQPPDLIATNGNGTRITPLWKANGNSWQMSWRASVSNGNVTNNVPFINYSISQGIPDISPDGSMVVWNDNGSVGYKTIDGGVHHVEIIKSDGATPMYVDPTSVVWTPMRWVTNNQTVNAAPTPTPGIITSSGGNDGCQPTRRVNVGSYVSVNPPSANNVRSEARLDALVSGKFAPGSLVQITDGPICADGFRWWYVSNDVLSGWTAEGDGTDYWLVPLVQSPFLNTCPLAPRLRSGDSAIVLGTTPNILRDGPDARGTDVIGEIPAGGTFQILGDSLCGTDGRRWYPVNYNETLGWTAEGEGSSYWIERR
jgi:hypothetical protein